MEVVGIVQRVATALGLSRSEGPSEGVIPPSRGGTGTVTADQALQIADVFRAVQIHETAAGQLTIDGIKAGQKLDETPSLLRQPYTGQSLSAFIEGSVVAMATTGNGFWRKTRSASTGQVIDLEPLNPHDVTVYQSRATYRGPGKIEYGYDGKTYSHREIQHLQLMRVPGRCAGLGPIQAAQNELAGVIDVRDYATGWFRDGQAQPNGVLSTDQRLTGEQAREYKQVWNDGADGGVRVLGAGLNYTPILLNPEDAQWIAARNFNVTQVARLFGVPASLMLAPVEGTNLTYQNVEQEWLAYVRFSLMAYLREIEEALTACLPHGTSARFDIDVLLRPDTKTRFESYQLGINAGFLLRSEARAREHLSPVPGIDDQPKPAPAPAPVAPTEGASA